MRRFKTCCIVCGIETRNTGKTYARPIDVCWKCHKHTSIRKQEQEVNKK